MIALNINVKKLNFLV